VYSQEASFVLLVFRRTWATPETRLMQLGNPWWSRCVGSSVCFCLSSGKYWEWCMYIYLYDSISLIVYSTAFASVQPPHLSSRFIKQTIELIAIEITHLLVLANLKCMYVHTYVKKNNFFQLGCTWFEFDWALLRCTGWVKEVVQLILVQTCTPRKFENDKKPRSVVLSVLSGINHSHEKKHSWFRDEYDLNIDIFRRNQYRLLDWGRST